MSRIVVLFFLAFCASASAVRAQTADSGYAQVNVGASAGKQAGALIAVEGGEAVTGNIEAFGELGWISSLQPATLAPSARTIAAFLQSSTGQAAAFSADTPAFFGGIGGRYFVRTRYGFRPYALASVGFIRIDQQVHFSLAGTDVTSRLADLGVTLGEDLDGAPTKGTLGVGVGALRPFRSLQLDFGYRYTRIFTRVGTNAHRVYAGVRYRF